MESTLAKLALLLLVVFLVKGDLLLSPTKKCGIKTCRLTEYCSEYEKICKNCADICERRTHNFDEHSCNSECQEYLHDLKYVRKDAGDSDNGDLRAEVRRLHTLVTISLTSTIILLILFLVVAILRIWDWKKRNHVTIATLRQKFCSCMHSDTYANETPKTTSATTEHKPELRLEIPTPGSGSEMSPATLTTSISRRPAEDNTLDYGAYDNHAMSNSPQHTNAKF